MSFPVAGTLMIEPTETEALAELDRFCDAMIAIRAEIDRGRAPASGRADDNPLVQRAPHRRGRPRRRLDPSVPTRARAPIPLDAVCASPSTGRPVGRIDGAYGDRNVVCSCPPLDAYR